MKQHKNIEGLFIILFLFITSFLLSAQNTDLLTKVRNNDLTAVKELVEAGANVNMRDDMMGYTPLMLSVFDGHKEMAALLISKGADINQQDTRTGYTPLMHALNSNKVDLAQFLIQQGADFKIKANDGSTALILACGVCPTIAKDLLSKGADIHALSEKGNGVFTQCIVVGMMRKNQAITPEFAKFLLEQGANIDEKNTVSKYKGYTPLFWAILSGETDIVKFLAENGANVNNAAENGKTPLSIAIESGDDDMVEILKNYGAR